MGFGPLELFFILVIVLLLFGTKKLRNVGGDLGGAIKNFKTAMNKEENKDDDSKADSSEAQTKLNDTQSGTTIEGTVENKTKEQI